jgi:hypothetical protein
VSDVNREGPGYWDGSVRGRDPAQKTVEEHYARDKASGRFKGCAGWTGLVLAAAAGSS